jgi:hypothetical protein
LALCWYRKRGYVLVALFGREGKVEVRERQKREGKKEREI